MQLKGWQCHRRLKKALLSASRVKPKRRTVSDVRWATDATYVWTRLDGLVYVNAALDCADRECIGLNVSQRNDAEKRRWALEDALIRRFGALPKATPTLRCEPTTRWSTLRNSTATGAILRLDQEFILPHTPEQNGVAESFMGTLKLECVWQHRFKTYDEAKRVIRPGSSITTRRRPHSRLDYLPPMEWRLRQRQITA